jgi:hypothetical protein
MADSVYQPVSDEDDQSETPPVSELSVVDPTEFRRRPDDQGEDLTVEEGAAQHRSRPDPESPEAASERPIVVHKVGGTEPFGLNEAADALRWSRAYKLGDELREAGLSQAQITEMGNDAIKRAEGIEPLAPPPPLVEGIDEYGRPDDGPLTPGEAADQLTAWRERHAQQQQEALVELAGEAAQHAQAEVQQQQAQPEPQPLPQPPPEQSERAQLAAERQRITHIKQMEGVEANERSQYDRLVQEIAQEFPSLRTAPPTLEQVEWLRQNDPARFQRLAQADQLLREKQTRIAALTQQRIGREQQQARANAQARAAARAEQDAAFERLAAQHIPGWETVHGEVRQQARKTLAAAGLSDQEIQHLWTSDDTIDAHSSALQLILAKAAMWDRASEKAHQVRQAPVPPVMRPGTYRASTSGADSVRELQGRLARASGREALKLATQLQRAKRASGD